MLSHPEGTLSYTDWSSVQCPAPAITVHDITFIPFLIVPHLDSAWPESALPISVWPRLQKKWDMKHCFICWAPEKYRRWRAVTFRKQKIQPAAEREGQGGTSSGIIRKVLGTERYIFLVLESPATVTEWAHSSPREHLGHWVITFLWSDSTQQLDTFINFTTWSLGALCFLFSSAGKLEEYRKCKTEGNWQKEQSRSCWKTPC